MSFYDDASSPVAAMRSGKLAYQDQINERMAASTSLTPPVSVYAAIDAATQLNSILRDLSERFTCIADSLLGDFPEKPEPNDPKVDRGGSLGTLLGSLESALRICNQLNIAANRLSSV